ncbi:hypothetical protein CY34DRAFT_798701 [Suillus luteus UH-Slu-Lm8-n1]|uniref:WD40 repeat-like protein n=1 Tax=Suillus luteus UH-Slu-Lm8-n1 TaxID=930992 RepID=A0A0D0ACX8_9AGAM|nr:hypothetical protein CY34DRAFT_798701 [Suillus luteus UH-Slu-Lm8-n1]
MSSPIVEKQKSSQDTPSQKFEGHTDSVYGALHLPGGQRMVTCSEDGSLRVWNVKSGMQIGDDWRDGESGVYTIALSPDGKKVASGGEDGAVRLWDIDTGKVIAKWIGHTKSVWSVCWSQDGQRVLSGSNDGTVREWDVKNRETILAPVETGHTEVFAAVYSPDTTMFATGGYNGSFNPGYDKSPVKIWDAKTGELVATLKGHTHSVLCLAWTTDGKILMSGSNDHSIRTWDTASWKQIRAVLDAHINGVFAIAISPNGRILASTSFDNTAQLWNLDNNQPIGSFLLHADSVFSVSFSADGKLLVTSCNDDNAYTWNVCMIAKETGLDDLLLDNSVLAANATRRPVQPIKVSHQVPRGFFDGDLRSPNRAHSSARRAPRDSPSRTRLFHWVRNLLSGRQSSVPTELRKHRSVVVDVPYAKGKRRNASAREKGRPIPKKAVASSSRPPNSNVTPQSSSAAQTQPSSQPQHAISTSSTTPAVVPTTASSTNPHVTIKNAGHWTRFWLFICCASTEYNDGLH